MDDLELVRVLQAVAHLDQQRDALFGGERPAAGFVLTQRLAFEIGHHQIEQTVGSLAQTEDGADVRMVEPHRDRRLPAQPLDRGGIAGEPRDEDLDRDGAAGIQLLRPVDVGHPALTEPTPDPVAAIEQLAAEGSQLIRPLDRREPTGCAGSVGGSGTHAVQPLSPPPPPPPARFRR